MKGRGRRTGAVMATVVVGMLAGSPGATAAESPVTINDIDGDGTVDVVHAAGGYGSDEGNGALTVAYGDGKRQRFVGQQAFGYPLPDPPLYDRDLGRLAEVADLDGDQYADLVVVGRGLDDAHSHVFVALGSAQGLSTDRIQRVEIPISDPTAVTVVPSPSPVIAIGSPDAKVAGVRSGAVYLVPVDASGTAGTGALLSQDSPGVPGGNEEGDRFGAALDASGRTLVVGSPGEGTGTTVDDGMIHVLRRTGTSLDFPGVAFHQDTAGVPGASEKGDHFGASVAIDGGRIAVGLPGEDLGSTKDAGMVVHFTDDGRTTKVAGAFNQNTSGIPGSNQTGDEFGVSVGLTRPCARQQAIIVGANEFSDDAGPRSTVVNVTPKGSCAHKIVEGAAVSLRRSMADTASDALLVAQFPQGRDPVAVERRHPYTATVRQWGTGDIDGGLHLVAPMAR